MHLDWFNCGSPPSWCRLDGLDLNDKYIKSCIGVYIIFSKEKVIRLGSGELQSRLQEHRNNPEITRYSELRVTFAHVEMSKMKGVEKFLADHYNPIVGDRFPERIPIVVNLPF